jgi:SurA N-terminal domain
VLRRVLTCAIGLGVLAGAAACSPVKMGAAATVGSQRITISQLDNQVASLNQVYSKYASQVQLTSAQVPSAVLSWLIRFQIGEQLAQNTGLVVTQTDGQTALNSLKSRAQQSAAQSGQPYSFEELLVANGIPPTEEMQNKLGRYEAIQLAWLKHHYGSSLSTTSQNAETTALNHAQCVAAKSLSVVVNPQFGKLDYSSFSVTGTPNLLSKPSGSSTPASTSVSSPSC